jgi:hypothetical protein
MSNTQAMRSSILVATFISCLVFLFLPSEIYLRNQLEFISATSVLVQNLVFAALALTVVLALPVLIPVIAWRKVYVIALGGVFLALWFSGVFLVADLGEFDGFTFELERHGETLVFQGGMFALVLITSCLAMWKWPAYTMRAIAVIGIGLIIIATANFYQASRQQDSTWAPVNLQDISHFSLDQNLLIVLMDTFQSDVLEQIIEKDPSVGEKLDGFRFYPDTMGLAPSTFLTMPGFHSGKGYDSMMSLSEYYDLGVQKESFLTELADNGYQVDLINPIAGTCPEGANVCQRQENLLLHADEVTDVEASRLADLGIFRVVPGLLKQRVFDGTSGPITRLINEIALAGLELQIYQGNTVLNLIADNLWADNSPPSAKLLHLFNTHPPYMFAEDCQFTGVVDAIDRAHMTMQTACAVRWFLYFLDKMKAQGVYDNSMIILTADTGAGNIYGEDDLSSLYAQRHGVPPGELGRLIGGANPVLAIKFPDQRGPIQNSSVPAQLTDIPRTVCETLGDCTNHNGLDLRTDERTDRERTYKYYRWENRFWSLNHIPGILHYAVNGPLWLESSWSRKFSDTMPVEVSKVKFSLDDDPELFGFGWAEVEVSEAGISKRWSIAKRAELNLPLPTGKNLNFEFRVLTEPALDNQVMTIKVNGEVVGVRNLEHRVQFVTVNVPARLLTYPVSEVVLEFSELKEPQDVGRRKLSVSFYELNIYEAPES